MFEGFVATAARSWLSLFTGNPLALHETAQSAVLTIFEIVRQDSLRASRFGGVFRVDVNTE